MTLPAGAKCVRFLVEGKTTGEDVNRDWAPKMQKGGVYHGWPSLVIISPGVEITPEARAAASQQTPEKLGGRFPFAIVIPSILIRTTLTLLHRVNGLHHVFFAKTEAEALEYLGREVGRKP
jgi:hypothetical protein